MTNKILILYKTQYGSTEQYAKWISEELKNSIFLSLDDFNPEILKDFNIIILGSFTKMGKIKIQDYLEKNQNLFKEKKIFMFTVGLVDFNSNEGQLSWINFQKNINLKIEHHEKFSGKINQKKINLLDKIIMKVVSKNLKNNFEKNQIIPFINKVKESL